MSKFPKPVGLDPKQPLSARLRKVGDVLSNLGKEIEESNVEDGDPPYAVSESQMTVFHLCQNVLVALAKKLAVATEE